MADTTDGRFGQVHGGRGSQPTYCSRQRCSCWTKAANRVLLLLSTQPLQIPSHRCITYRLVVDLCRSFFRGALQGRIVMHALQQW